MAILTKKQLAKSRRDVCEDEHPDFDKVIINKVLQAIENELTTVDSKIRDIVDKAAGSYKFSDELIEKLYKAGLGNKEKEEK